jgi:hypothetical protein
MTCQSVAANPKERVHGVPCGELVLRLASLLARTADLDLLRADFGKEDPWAVQVSLINFAYPAFGAVIEIRIPQWVS